MTRIRFRGSLRPGNANQRTTAAATRKTSRPARAPATVLCR